MECGLLTRLVQKGPRKATELSGPDVPRSIHGEPERNTDCALRVACVREGHRAAES